MASKKRDELSTFRIADVKRPEVRSFHKAGAEAESTAEPESMSVGFPAVEARLESGTIEDLAESLRPSYEKLEDLAEKGDIKSKAAARNGATG